MLQDFMFTLEFLFIQIQDSCCLVQRDSMKNIRFPLLYIERFRSDFLSFLFVQHNKILIQHAAINKFRLDTNSYTAIARFILIIPCHLKTR